MEGSGADKPHDPTQGDENGAGPSGNAPAGGAGPTPAPAAKTTRPRIIQQKTPQQKQALEAAFYVNNFPDEPTRKLLADQLGLTEPQVNTWFAHRRRRERDRANAAKEAGEPAPPPLMTPPIDTADPTTMMAASLAMPGVAEAVINNAALRAPTPVGAADAEDTESEAEKGQQQQGKDDEVDVNALSAEDRVRLEEYNRLLLAARSMLDVPFREDGPPLGLDFDDVPQPHHDSDKAAGSGAKGKKRKGAAGDPDFSVEGQGGEKRAKSADGGRAIPVGPADLERIKREEEARAAMLTEKARQQVQKLEASIRKEQDKLAREKEKQDLKAAKERERELVRLEAEHRRQLERVLREQRKEEERRAKEEARMRALQEKEEKRLAAQRERELKAEEKRREKEEKKREREMLRALNQQERQAMRVRDRGPNTGPKDDLDLEWDALILDYRKRTGLPTDIPNPTEGSEAPQGYPPLPVRQPFPPPQVILFPAVQVAPEVDPQPSLAAVGALLAAWAALAAFSPVLGLECPTLDELAVALAEGMPSKTLAAVHIAILRLLQADAEEAYALGDGLGAEAKAAAAAAAAGSHVHIIAPGARLLEEAWAWGFDVDAWRAHLNVLTWPEIARELGIAAGLGRKRPETRKRDGLAKMGKEGEDIVVGSKQDTLELRLPSRLTPGSVKGAAWLVLKDAGHEGLHVEEIARRIQHKGLRDLRTSKSPETSVAGALARDVLFERVKPATFALQSHCAHHRKLQMQQHGTAEGAAPVKKEEEGIDGDAAGAVNNEIKKEESSPTGKEENTGHKDEKSAHDEHDEYEEEESENEEEAEERRLRDELHLGEKWVAVLRDHDYNSLSLDDRIEMLNSLCQLALESPSVREMLDRRLEEQQRIKRQSWEDAKIEASLQRQRKQAEQAAKLRAAAEDAQKLLDRLNAMQNGAVPSGSAVQGSTAQQGTSAMEIDGGSANHDSAARAAAEAAIAAAAAAGVASGSALATEAEDKEAAAKRSQARHAATMRELEANFVRSEPLGMDRRFNKYWRFVNDNGISSSSSSTDTNAGRIFVESQDDGMLRMICTADALDALMSSLNRKGPREKALHAALLRYKPQLVAGMPSQPLQIPSPSTSATSVPTLEELLDACPVTALKNSLGGGTSSTAPSSSQISPYSPDESAFFTVLKTDLLAVEYSLPEEVLEESFDPDEWRKAVQSATTPVQLRSCLGQLEAAIGASALHQEFSKDPLLVKGAWVSIGEEVASALPGSTAAEMILPMSPVTGAAGHAASDALDNAATNDNKASGPPEHLAWLPPTLSAIAFRLSALDAALKYGSSETAARDHMLGYRHIIRPGLLPGSKDGVLVGPALHGHGRMCPMLISPFPYRLLFGPRLEFSFDVKKFQEHVAIGSDDLVIAEAGKGIAGLGHRGRGGGGYRGGRPKGSKNKAKLVLTTPGGAVAPGAGASVMPGSGNGRGSSQAKRRGRGGGVSGAMGLHRSSIPAKSDSEKHYGSDYDAGDDEDEEYMSEMPGSNAGTARGGTSVAPSTAPSTAPASEAEIEDELMSEEEEEEDNERPDDDEYKPEEDEEAEAEEEEEEEEEEKARRRGRKAVSDDEEEEEDISEESEEEEELEDDDEDSDVEVD